MFHIMDFGYFLYFAYFFFSLNILLLFVGGCSHTHTLINLSLVMGIQTEILIRLIRNKKRCHGDPYIICNYRHCSDFPTVLTDFVCVFVIS